MPFMQCVIMLSVVRLNVVLLNALMLSVVMLNIVMLSVMAPLSMMSVHVSTIWVFKFRPVGLQQLFWYPPLHSINMGLGCGG
jgi:hypothetical protein